MSFIINGTTINSIKFNNTDINTLICNGEEVYSGVPAIYNTVKNASSNVTESQWLEFIDNDCIALAISRGETADFIGKNVTLSNSVVSNYTSWKIADFNHDSSGNTVDLIQNNTIYNSAFGSSQTYSSSTARSWLTGTYLPGFSTNVKNKLQTMTVVTGSGNVSDKIKLLSCDEVGITSTHKYYSYSEREGSRYPIFNAGGTGDYQTDSSRVRTGTNTAWWLRSRYTNYTSYVWFVSSTGDLNSYNCTASFGLVPCIRFKNVVIPAIYNTVKNASSNVTEAQWLEFVNSGCIALARELGETSSFIGKNVTLSNSAVPDYTSWKIADFGHDSSGNTVDLIQNNTIYQAWFGIYQTYSNSNVRSWLINTYLPGFSSDIQSKLQTINVTTNGGNTSDKIKLLSVTEVGGSGTTDAPTGEGSRYPIFTSSKGSTANNSRVRTGTGVNWWLRSRYTSNTSLAWAVTSTGYLEYFSCSGTCGLLPAIRFAQ